jgi:hypothetical protein
MFKEKIMADENVPEFSGKKITRYGVEIPEEVFNKIERDKRIEIESSHLKKINEVFGRSYEKISEAFSEIGSIRSGYENKIQELSAEEKKKPKAEDIEAEIQKRVEIAVAERNKEIEKSFNEKQLGLTKNSFLNEVKSKAIALGLKDTYQQTFGGIFNSEYELVVDSDKILARYNDAGKPGFHASADEITTSLKAKYPELFKSSVPGIPQNTLPQNTPNALGSTDLLDQAIAQRMAGFTGK